LYNKKKLIFILTGIILFSIISFNIISNNRASSSEAIQGSINENIATMFLLNDFYSDFNFSGKTSSSIQFSANKSWQLNFSLFSLRIEVLDFRTDTRTFNIANNTKNSSFVNDNRTTAIAQQFTFDRPTYVEKMMIYINNSKSNTASKITINFYKDLDQNPINPWPMSYDIDALFKGWKEVWIFLYFSPGTYYYRIDLPSMTGGSAIPKAGPKFLTQDNVSSNSGLTQIFNSSKWMTIQDDYRRDILSNFSIFNYYYPDQLNMTVLIDGQEIQLDILENPWSFYLTKYYYLSEKPSKSINITLKLNQTNNYGHLQITGNYFATLNATGTYTILGTSISANIKYYVVNSSMLGSYYFLYPSDWNMIDYYNNYNNKVEEFFLGSFKIYGNSYWGITDWLFTGDGIYSANFSIPNYLSNYKIEILENNFLSSSSVKLGDTLRITAKILDTSGNPLSGGTCNITLKKPDNEIITINCTINNGNITSDLISTTNWAEGQGSITIFWTDGVNFGYIDFIYIIYKETLPWGLIITAISIIGAAIPATLYVRKKVIERNWEKSLLYIFGLTREGMSLFGKTFRIDLQDPALISGMIAAITNFAMETMKSKRALRVIDHEDKKVILSHGPNYIIALMAEKDLGIIRTRLDQFATEFGQQFGHKIKNWKGETKAFKGVDILIEKYFPLSIEQKMRLGVGTKIQEMKEILTTTEEQSEVISVLKEISSMTLRYKEIIKTYFQKEYDEILKIADDKISQF